MILFFVLYKFLFFLSDFLEIQRTSFDHLISFQFGKEFASIKPGNQLNPRHKRGRAIFNYNFISNNYRFVKPFLTIEQSIIRSKTYCSHFYIPVRFSFLSQSIIKWVFLGTLPLLTRRGHFIINGTPRIVLNQIVRSAGIYFNKNSQGYYGEIIFNRGPWIRLEIDYQKKIWVCIQEIPRIEISAFLKIFHQKYIDHIYRHDGSLLSTEGSPKGALRGEALPHLELGKIGRFRLNKKLNICLNDLNLTPIDLVMISNHLYKLTLGSETVFDDIDDLKNRRLKTIGELIQNQLTRGLMRLKKIFVQKNQKFEQLLEKFKIIETSLSKRARARSAKHLKHRLLQNFIKIRALNYLPINSSFKEFFHSHQLSQYLDQSNPLAEMTHKRRLSCFGSGGINSENAGMEIRGIHRTHYGRICPIETPEGKNAGLVNSLTTAVHVDSQGFLETPFIEIYKQHIQNHKKISFLCVEKQMNQNVFLSPKLSKSKNLFVPIIKSQTQNKCAVDQIHFLAFHPQQFISVGTTCIPFVEHNDANRALMGSNMQRQALPLLKLEQPIVNTLNSFRVISDLRDIPTSAQSGLMKLGKTHHYQNQIYFGWKKFVLISKALLNFYSNSSRAPLGLASAWGGSIYQIWFKGFAQSNQNTYLFQRSLASLACSGWSGWPEGALPASLSGSGKGALQWIQKGDLLADCSASHQLELALGQNLLAAYMPWEGLNFEDAVLINNKIVSKYTSLHIEKYETQILEEESAKASRGPKVRAQSSLSENILKRVRAPLGLPAQRHALNSLDENGIIKIGSWVKEGDILVGQITSSTYIEKEKVQHERLLYDIVGKDKHKHKQIKIQDLRVPSGVSGRIIKILICSQKIQRSNRKDPSPIKGSISLSKKKKAHRHAPFGELRRAKCRLSKIAIYIAEKRELKIGDKVSGRHGNKGIISQIFGPYDMPYLPNGECLDILLNPLGVPSRMNVGQILECVLGLTGHIFHTKFQITCFDEIDGYEASRSLIYSKLLECSNQVKQKWLFSKKTPGKVHIFDGRNGQIFHQSILIGYAYIMKLIHIVDEKIHARSTGPYSLITQQPLRGRAKQGGQRVGEMEVWALQGFGSAYILQELLTIKSDDLVGRNRLMFALLKNTSLHFGTPESLRVVLRELQSLCLDFNLLYQ
uniref:DNA-directed RNA polymerase subunit beta n=1 Tax=Caulerpa cliftonii TaxID=1004391 RepID=A0A1C9JBV4_9CHLO|nr:RNA polymerase b-subunit [Caulerpa cliftonii]AOP19324.1 RNA polymerase b-subunit [Caulerpa cliftonii]